MSSSTVFLSSVLLVWNLNNKMCLQAALVEDAGWTPAAWQLPKHLPSPGGSCKSTRRECGESFLPYFTWWQLPPSPLANSFSSSSSGKWSLPLACSLAEREAGVTLLSRAHWRASRDLRTDPVPVLHKSTGYTTFGFSAGSGPVFQWVLLQAWH